MTLENSEVRSLAAISSRGPISYVEYKDAKALHNMGAHSNLGRFAEGEHILEQHSLNNDPRYSPIADQGDQGTVIIVVPPWSGITAPAHS